MGLRNMAAKYTEYNVSQSVTNTVWTVSTKLSIIALIQQLHAI